MNVKRPVNKNIEYLKHGLVKVIDEYIRQKQWTQVEAGTQLGLCQARISNLQCYKIEMFSIEALLGLLGKIGYQYGLDTTQTSSGILSLTFLKIGDTVKHINNDDQNDGA